MHLHDALCISSHAFPFDLLLLLSNLQDCWNKPEICTVIPVVNKGFHIVDLMTFLVEIVNTFYDFLVIFILKLIIYNLLN